MKTIDNLKLPKTEDQAIREASGQLKELFPVEAVILFGSMARKEHDQESDIDLLVLTTRPITWEERKAIIGALFDIQQKYQVIFSPLIVEKHDWEKGPISLLPIHSEIEKDGVRT